MVSAEGGGSMTEKLKPCSFCGKRPSEDIAIYSFGDGHTATITCSCGAKMNSESFYKEQCAKQDAVDKWNRRAE